MTAHLRADFENARNIYGQEKADCLLAIVTACDPQDKNDRMTLYNILGNVGIFEKRGIDEGFYTIEEVAHKGRSLDLSEFHIPRDGSIYPVMTIEQAGRAIEFLKAELSPSDKPRVFYCGAHERILTPD